jgi:adrenodoxin-NADP+ reductase
MDAYSVSDMILSENQFKVPGSYIPPPLTPHPTEPPLDILSNGTDLQEEVPPLISEGARNGVITTYEDWKVVDEYELKEGKACGKERVKLIWSEVLDKGLIRR